MLYKIIVLVLFFPTLIACMTQKKMSDGKKQQGITALQNQSQKVDAYVQQQMKENHIPGLSLAVVQSGKVILAKGYGMANLEWSMQVTEKTNFLIYSITKTLTAAATMMLVEEGKISLEDPISKYLPGLPVAWHPVTIRQLLNHTSGINSFTQHKQSPCGQRKDELDYTQADVLNEVACLPLDFQPGEKWSYTDTGYYLLGMLIEKISGKTYEQFLQERIFTPLEMRNTRHYSSTDLIPNRADGYSWEHGSYNIAHLVQPVIEFSNGGLVSTVLDLAKWDAALYTEKLLKKSTLEQMWTNAKLNNGEIVTRYGLGFALTPYGGHRRVAHPGGGPGFTTAFSRFIDDNVSVIVLTNADTKGYKTDNDFLIDSMASEIASFYFKN